MQGHVDGVGTVTEVRDDGFARVVTIARDARGPALRRREGLDRGRRRVADGRAHRRRGLRRLAHPRDARAHEPRRARRRAGRVNLEVDVLAKYVEKLLGTAVKDAYEPREPHNLRRDWTV